MEAFEGIVRAVIIHEDRILLCKRKDKSYWFFPGGHIEKDEKVYDALKREIHEELGEEIKSFEFIGAGQNIYEKDNEKINEFNLVFSVELESYNLKSAEDHLEFSWATGEDLSQYNILPENLVQDVIKWNKTKKTFFTQ